MSTASEESKESRSLQFILSGKTVRVNDFFSSNWQKTCSLYTTEPTTGNVLDCGWNARKVIENPLAELLLQKWTVLVDLMDRPYHEIPLLFQNCCLLEIEEARQKYSDSTEEKSMNLWSAFLDGCSIVLNHADLQSPWIAAVCEDLQLSFPHAYANAYLTPASSQAVPAHADDRDVFIIQVYGRKEWTVYANIPVPYPYPHEQVGKADIPIPDSVTQGPILIQRTLSPGDVMYMPRGYVHKAVSCDYCCSFHVTVALATHDWSLAGMLSSAARDIFTGEPQFRLAVDRSFGRQASIPNTPSESVSIKLQSQIDLALTKLHNEVTVESVHKAMQNKLELHNRRSGAIRQPLIQNFASVGLLQTNSSAGAVVGPHAARSISMETPLRAATTEERASVQSVKMHGLHVRDDIYDGVLTHIARIKERPCCLAEIVSRDNSLICDLTLLSMARRCVQLGALAIGRATTDTEMT